MCIRDRLDGLNEDVQRPQRRVGSVHPNAEPFRYHACDHQYGDRVNLSLIHISGKQERRFGELIFREGDRVMQTRNDYDVVWQKEDGP